MQIFLEFFSKNIFNLTKMMIFIKVIVNSKVMHDTTLVYNVIWPGIWQLKKVPFWPFWTYILYSGEQMFRPKALQTW